MLGDAIQINTYVWYCAVAVITSMGLGIVGHAQKELRKTGCRMTTARRLVIAVGNICNLIFIIALIFLLSPVLGWTIRMLLEAFMYGFRNI